MTPLDLIRQKCIEAGAGIELQGCTEHWNKPQEQGCESCRRNFYRPIRLADVLLAMAEEPVFCAFEQDFFILDFPVKRAENIRIEWNLRQDDLTKQSEETITFLADLLK